MEESVHAQVCIRIRKSAARRHLSSQSQLRMEVYFTFYKDRVVPDGPPSFELR